MKDSLLNIITKSLAYIKRIIYKTSSNVKFEEEKNEIIKMMYNPIFQEKKSEEGKLLSEFRKLKQEESKLNGQISSINEENRIYNKKIEALYSFQEFLINK